MSSGGRTALQERCPLCGGAERRSLAACEELEWVACRCGLIYKLWETDAPGQDYGASYFDGTGKGGGAAYDRRRRRRIAKARSQILDAVAVTEPGPLLDVGCSLGYALEAAASLGLRGVGVDVSEHAVEACRRRGLEARVGTLEALPVDDGAMAAVLMKHVFEHAPRPRRVLAEVRRVLRPGGALFLAVPHAGYWKAVRRPESHRFYLPDGHGREHFVYYRPETLSALLADEGFETKSVHPRLLHRRAPALRRLWEWAVLPVRWPAARLVTALSLRKEFWLVAVKSQRRADGLSRSSRG